MWRACSRRAFALAGAALLAPGVAALVALAGPVPASAAAPAAVIAARPAKLLSSSAPAFPLHVSASKRYLVDRKGRPFLIVGDSPQALIVNLSTKAADEFLRRPCGRGFQLDLDQPPLRHVHGRSRRRRDIRRDRAVHDAWGSVHAESRLLRPCRRDDPPRGQAPSRGIPRPDRDRWLAQRPRTERREWPTATAAMSAAVPPLFQHRLAQRQRLPDLEPPRRRRSRRSPSPKASDPPIPQRCRQSSSTTT